MDGLASVKTVSHDEGWGCGPFSLWHSRGGEQRFLLSLVPPAGWCAIEVRALCKSAQIIGRSSSADHLLRLW